MKKIHVFLGMLLLSAIIFSCSSNDEVQESVIYNNGLNNFESGNNEFEAQAAPYSISEYAETDFRIRISIRLLKVPKRINPTKPFSTSSAAAIDCSFGFGVCVDITISWFAQDPALYGLAPKVLPDTEEVIAVFNHDPVNKKVTFYVPKDMGLLPEFSSEDLQKFTIYEDLDMGEGVVLKPGDYDAQYDSLGNFVYAVDTY